MQRRDSSSVNWLEILHFFLAINCFRNWKKNCTTTAIIYTTISVLVAAAQVGFVLCRNLEMKNLVDHFHLICLLEMAIVRTEPNATTINITFFIPHRVQSETTQTVSVGNLWVRIVHFYLPHADHLSEDPLRIRAFIIICSKIIFVVHK